MAPERLVPLDLETIALFAAKGTQGNLALPQLGNANGVKVRRVMQCISDFAKKPVDQLRILDLACGEGVYSIEAGLRGATVLALDGRTERMNEGAKAAERLGLERIRFEQYDIRRVTRETHGSFDVVLLLGIVYHLDQHEAHAVLGNACAMCEQFVVIDTHVAMQGQTKVDLDGRSYEGRYVREHDDNDPDEVRRARLLASLDTPRSFWFTKASLFRMLHDVGFTSACECNVPLEPGKPENRVTIVAVKGDGVRISSYPWINGKTEDEIAHFLAPPEQQPPADARAAAKGGGVLSAKFLVNKVLRPFGLKISRL